MTDMQVALRGRVVRAHPYVDGHTKRFKSEPTKLNSLALRVMCASGSFSSKRAAAVRSRPGRFFGAVALLLTAGTFAITGDAHQVDGRAWTINALSAQPDSLFTLGVDDYRPIAAPQASLGLNDQDQFEIARFYRKGSIVRE